MINRTRKATQLRYYFFLRNFRSNILSQLKVDGVTLSIIFLISVALFFVITVLGWGKIEPRLGLIDMPDKMVTGLRSIYIRHAFCAALYFFCCITLFLIFIHIIILLSNTLSLMLNLSMVKLRIYRNIEVKYFAITRRKLTKPYNLLLVITVICVICCFVLCTIFSQMNAHDMFRISFLGILVATLIMFVYKYIYEWKKLKPASPNFLKRVYGRKVSLGNFAQVCLLMLLITFSFRVVVPLYYEIIKMVFDPFFSYRALSLLNSLSALKIEQFLVNSTGKSILEFINISGEGFSVVNFISTIVADFNIDKDLFVKQIFTYLLITSVVFSFFSLLVPMILYNLLLSKRKAFKKAIEASLVGLVGGFFFHWGVSWLFLQPLPRLESSSFASLVIFTFYVNWVFSK